jgi:hypothetical protein
MAGWGRDTLPLVKSVIVTYIYYTLYIGSHDTKKEWRLVV